MAGVVRIAALLGNFKSTTSARAAGWEAMLRKISSRCARYVMETDLPPSTKTTNGERVYIIIHNRDFLKERRFLGFRLSLFA